MSQENNLLGVYCSADWAWEQAGLDRSKPEPPVLDPPKIDVRLSPPSQPRALPCDRLVTGIKTDINRKRSSMSHYLNKVHQCFTTINVPQYKLISLYFQRVLLGSLGVLRSCWGRPLGPAVDYYIARPIIAVDFKSIQYVRQLLINALLHKLS